MKAMRAGGVVIDPLTVADAMGPFLDENGGKARITEMLEAYIQETASDEKERP